MVRNADYAIVMDEGKLIESGSPEDLINAGGWFSEFSKVNMEDNETYS